MTDRRRRSLVLSLGFAAACATHSVGQVVQADAHAAPRIPIAADYIDVLATGPEDRVRYDSVSVVRVAPVTARQLAGAVGLAESVWSERVGLGPIELAVSTDAFGALRALGLEPEVLVDDLQGMIDLEWQQIQQAELLRGTGFYDTFRQFPEIISRVNQLATDRPDLAQTEVIGQSLQGRDLVGIRITGPGDATNRPRIVWNGCQHAREWISPMVVTYLAEQLVSLYDTDPEIRDLVDSIEFVIVPVVNPDGYVYSWSNERLWRKNRRGGFGVDLNRNWSVGFGGEGSSGSTDSDIYRGPSPFSEPESAAMRNYILSQPNLVGHIDFHAFSQLILRPYGFDFVNPPEPDNTLFTSLGSDMQQAMLDAGGVFYENIPGSGLYLAGGIMTDWAYDEAGAFSYTYELRPATQNPGFVLPPDQILPNCEEILVAMRVYAGTLRQPFSLAFDSPVVGSIDAGQPTPVSVSASAIAGAIDGATAELRYRVAGESQFQSLPLIDAGNGAFTGDLPAQTCGVDVEFFATALSTTGIRVNEPAGGANAPLVRTVVDTTVAFSDDVETVVAGWTLGLPSDDATSGRWERRDPEPTGAQPGDDASQNGTVCFITDGRAGGGLGSFDIDGGRTTLISPRLDATAPEGSAGDAVLSYSRWYSNNQGAAPDADEMVVSISNDDGDTWSTLETVTENLGRWERVSFVVADTLAPTDSVRVRFVASDLGEGSVVEAGVDDVEISFSGCDTPTADWDGNGSVDVFDILAYLTDFELGSPDADLTGEGTVNVFDILAFLDLFNQATGG